MTMHVGNTDPDLGQAGIRVGANRLQSVQQMVSEGQYEVDCELVATAMLERIGANVSDRELISSREGGRVLLEALSGLRAA